MHLEVLNGIIALSRNFLSHVLRNVGLQAIITFYRLDGSSLTKSSVAARFPRLEFVNKSQRHRGLKHNGGFTPNSNNKCKQKP